MILDSSALIAVILNEPGADALLQKIDAATVIGIGAPTVVETAIVLARRLQGDPKPLLRELLREMDVEVIDFTEQHALAAQDAFMRFGKGRHPAALNFGDCMAYAVASISKRPLLYVGGDYSQTEVTRA